MIYLGKNNNSGRVNLNSICKYAVDTYSSSAIVLAQLYKVAITTGFTNALVTCAFFAQSRIDTPHGRSMSPFREIN